MGTANPSVYASGSGASLYATVTWSTGPEVTVNVSSTASWKMVPRGSSGHSGILRSDYATDSYYNTFTATDGGQYIFQVYDAVEGTYYNQDFGTSGFTVNFGDDSGGGGSGGGGDSSSAHIMHINPGKGTKITVYRSWSDNESSRGQYLAKDTVEPVTATIYYPADRFEITAEALPGYEIDYYDDGLTDDGDTFYTENLEKFYSSEDKKYRYAPMYEEDVYVNATAKAISITHIYNGSARTWDEYGIFIYNKGSGWERYAPYIYNGSTWNRYS